MNDVKNKICEKIDSYKDELIGLSHCIHDNPELSGEEYAAAAALVSFMGKHGFKTETKFCGMDTAFRAVKKGAAAGPVVAFIAEYDTLEGIGHACGHNIIASGAAGAALGLAGFIEDEGGEIRVIGCPAEEKGDGKITLLKNGAFDDVDFVLEVHPSNKNIISRGNIACTDMVVEYFGKSAHSSDPASGVNALSALILLFNQIDVLRQRWNTNWTPRVNGIIREGGKAANVITPYACGSFMLRAEHTKELLAMIADIKKAAECSAGLLGAEVKTRVGQICEDTIPNRTMGLKFAENMTCLGEKMNLPAPNERRGSSDIGNVSRRVPTIHEYLRINQGKGPHTDEFREAAVSERGDEVVLLAAKGMAMTASDLFTDQEFRKKALEEFKEATKEI